VRLHFTTDWVFNIPDIFAAECVSIGAKLAHTFKKDVDGTRCRVDAFFTTGSVIPLPIFLVYRNYYKCLESPKMGFIMTADISGRLFRPEFSANFFLNRKVPF
jgi:hypothetical protein